MGKSAEEAFNHAGYRERGRASVQRIGSLRENADILGRVAELGQDLAASNPVTIAMLTEGLLRIARDCEASDAATAKNVARGAYMDIAKLNGLIKERSESSIHVVQEITDQPLSEREWAERYTTG